MASGWHWLNLALILILTLNPIALICMEFLPCKHVSCSPGTGDPGRFDQPGDRLVSVLDKLWARQLAMATCTPDSIMSPGALLRVHIPRGALLARDDRPGFLCAASPLVPRSILFDPRVMGLGV